MQRGDKMDEVVELLEKKYELLRDVLTLCNNLKYHDDMEENMQIYIDFHETRQPIFEKLTSIDNLILEITNGEGSFTNDKIKAISKEILEFDRNNKKNEEEFKTFITTKMKTVSDGLKINKKLNPIAFVDEASGLDIKG